MCGKFTVKCLSLFLALILCLGLLQPATVFATDATENTDTTVVTETPADTVEDETEATESSQPTKNLVASVSEEPGVSDYETFMQLLKVLEGYADKYASTANKPAAELVINFIRTGVERYNDGNWKTLAGEEITGFTTYVEEQDAAKETNAMLLRNIIIDDFKIPNGNLTDFGHMFGTLNIAYINSVASADLGGWAGDICDLLRYCKENGNIPAGTIDEMAVYILENCFGIDADQAFGMDDFYGDMDAYYLNNQVKAGKKLSVAMEEYFTAQLTDADRAAYFMNNRFSGLETREDVREAVHDTYSSNVGLKVLEADRGLSGETDLRKAACYAFADYLFNHGGDRLEGDPGEGEGGEDGGEDEDPMDNKYYSVFSSTSSILAPGIEQTIKYAMTADDQQIVYYLATVEVAREDVTIMANYHNNDPSQGWATQRVQDQAAAMMKNYADPSSPKYIENFNIVVATNGDGFNIATGEPGGLLVMDGVEWYGIDKDGFFAILKDGSAMIGTKADYATYKSQIQEGIGGFGAVLIRDGEVVVADKADYTGDRASRTAIGITAEGKVVMMVLDGRQAPFSCGGSMQEIAQIMLDAGCVEAINLDGGGSTTYMSKPEGSDTLQVVNRPSDGYARSVATSLVAVSTAKSSKEFDHANISSEYDYLTIGTSLQMNAAGVSNTGNSAPLPENAAWQVSDDTIGTVSADGMFLAAANGDVTVQLAVDGTVVGEKTLHVVVPDTLYFEKNSITAIYGEPCNLPLVATYQGNTVCINSYDVLTSVANRKAGTIRYLTFTPREGTGLRNVDITAKLRANSSITAKITVNMFSKDEAYFDFDNITAGNRTLAWLREITNVFTSDNKHYQVEDTNEPIDITYTFALDMTAIEIPGQLADLTHMLPGADQGSTAWDFLLQLAERVGELTEVKITAQFDPDLEVDISNLKVANDFFYKKSATLDENNNMTLVCGWTDQTQAIDPATANPNCILSGIKAIPKSGAWNADKIAITNIGEVSYRVFLRASSLYSFACDPANQATYSLVPYSGDQEEFYFNGQPLMYGSSPERGAYFGTVYSEFEDSFTLDRSIRQGWMMVGDYYQYFVDNKPVTGIHYLPSREDPAVKLYYEFEDDGVLNGTVTGLFELDGDLHYAIQGKRQVGWCAMYDADGNPADYYFDPYTGKAVDGACKVEGYNYVFENHILKKGELVKDSNGTRYRWAGLWTHGRWVEVDGNLYHFPRYQYYAATGWTNVVGQDLEKNWHLFDENGVFQKDYSGMYDVGNATYLLANGVLVPEPGLVLLDDGYYYYFCATGKAVKNCTYWPTKTNGLLPIGPYVFDELGRIVNPPVEEPENPGPGGNPDSGETPEQPPVKEGLVQENGGYFYYENGTIQFGKGLIRIGEDYYYIRSNGQAAVGNYWITTTNGLLPSAMYTFGADGKMITEEEEPENPNPENPNPENPNPEGPSEPELPPVKDGFVSERGAIYYYDNGIIKYGAGIVQVDGDYYYVRSNGQLATGNYWPTATNGLVPQGMYRFDENGKMLNPPSSGEPDEPIDPDQPTNPGEPEQPEPELPPVKQGIIEEGGVLYYYENGYRAYGKGVVMLTDETGTNYYVYVRSNGQLATGTYWPTITNDLLPMGPYNWGTDGRLYR